MIPLVRGASRSRRAEAVLAEIRRRVGTGAPRGRPDRASTSAATATARPATRSRASCARRARRPGLARLRLSSIEVNHVDDELVAALRETPTVARHLHVPLQSGDDGVLRAMGRRYTVDDLPAPARAAREDFNLTSDVIVGFPAEDERRVPSTLASSSAPGSRRCTSSRTRRGPGRARRPSDPVPPQVKKERSARLRALSHERLPRAAGGRRSARDDIVLVDRPGRGYGDDYSPWLVDAPVGELVRVRGAARDRGGDPSLPEDCLFCRLVRERRPRRARRRVRRDPRHRPARPTRTCS